LTILQANIPRVLAQERLRELRFNPSITLTANAYLELCRAAWDDEERAQSAAQAYQWQQARRSSNHAAQEG
jgi:hypothetical protein